VHTDLLQPLHVPAIAINPKFKLKKTTSFSSIMIKDQSKWISFSAESTVTIQYTESVQFCFGDFGVEGKKEEHE